MFVEEIKESLIRVVREIGVVENINIALEHPADLEHGDYSTNIALKINKNCRDGACPVSTPFDCANDILNKWQEVGLPEFVEKVEVAGPGFLNIWLNFDAYSKQLTAVLSGKENFGSNSSLSGKKIMVEFAHPNTHKELHIGHMRTLITGEALSRILSACGAEVFRANYQGDIGPHVAKAIWGTKKILAERNISWEEAEKLSLAEKAHLLGEGYIRGNQDYEQFEKEIDELNVKLYQKDTQVFPDYERTRRWSLDYYDSFYNRFLTKFDRLFFESEVAEEGKRLVLENTSVPQGDSLRACKESPCKKVFEKSEGAVIFDGEKFGLHKRVFITANGTPTYEAKEMALAKAQFGAFPFDKNIHVVANEQTGYFKVVIKALEELFPEMKDKEHHLAMGMVNLVGQKMSSRTGVILRVDDLLEEVKAFLEPLIRSAEISGEEKEKIAEVLTIAAVKYSVLRVDPQANVTFDPQKSVSLQGDSGPYIQYSYARTQSVLRKVVIPTKRTEGECVEESLSPITGKGSLDFARDDVSEEEMILLRTLYRFPEIVEEAGREYSPNLICNFIYDIAQKFNLFYDKERIIGSENEEFRLILTEAVGQVLKNGLNLLGIEALEKM